MQIRVVYSEQIRVVYSVRIRVVYSVQIRVVYSEQIRVVYSVRIRVVYFVQIRVVYSVRIRVVYSLRIKGVYSGRRGGQCSAETKCFESTVKILPPPGTTRGGANKVALRKHCLPPLYLFLYTPFWCASYRNAVWHEIKTCIQTFRIVFHPNIMEDVFTTLSNLFYVLSTIINHYQPLSTLINPSNLFLYHPTSPL